MTRETDLTKAIERTRQVIAYARDRAMEHNQPEWHGDVLKLLDLAKDYLDTHTPEYQIEMVADHYDLIAVKAREIPFPDDEDMAPDSRAAALFGAIGQLIGAADVVTRAAAALGKQPTSAGQSLPEKIEIDRSAHQRQLDALLGHVREVREMLKQKVEPEATASDHGALEQAIIGDYIEEMRLTDKSISTAIGPGDKVNLALIERFVSRLATATYEMTESIKSWLGLAAKRLRVGVEAVRKPVRRAVGSVGSLIVRLVRKERKPAPPAPISPKGIINKLDRPLIGYISYSHEDAAVCQELLKHLRATERAYGIQFWIDNRNQTGQHYFKAVKDAIAASSVHILLTSSNSLWSDAIMDWEIPAILKKQQTDGDLVLPVVVDDCRWQGIAGTLLASPRDDRLNLKPIKSWAKQSKALDRVRKELEAALSSHFGMTPNVSIPINDRENTEDEPITQKDIRPPKLGEVAPPLPDDYLEQARDMILAGKVPPAHWSSHIKALDFGGTELANIGPLAVMTELESLDLSETQVSDITALAGLNALKSLVLSETQVSDITALVGLNALKSLDLSGSKVSDITPLAKLNALTSLNLAATKISDITPLAGMSALKDLNLSFTQVSDIAPLVGMNALTDLNLWDTQVSDITMLARLNALRTLFLYGTQVSDIMPLARLNTLTWLYLSGTQVSDIAALSGIPRLTVSVGSKKQANALRRTLARGSTVVVTP
jgi:Leucine-rich repeat (LRR) protein